MVQFELWQPSGRTDVPPEGPVLCTQCTHWRNSPLIFSRGVIKPFVAFMALVLKQHFCPKKERLDCPFRCRRIVSYRIISGSCHPQEVKTALFLVMKREGKEFRALAKMKYYHSCWIEQQTFSKHLKYKLLFQDTLNKVSIGLFFNGVKIYYTYFKNLQCL